MRLTFPLSLHIAVDILSLHFRKCPFTFNKHQCDLLRLTMGKELSKVWKSLNSRIFEL